MPHPHTLLLATDIFGHTPEMQAFARRIGGAARVVSPYGHERPRFVSEMEAYGAFQAAGGVEGVRGARQQGHPHEASLR